MTMAPRLWLSALLFSQIWTSHGEVNNEDSSARRKLGRPDKDKKEDDGNDSRIVGGKDAAKGRYKSVVALYNAQGGFECGGSLILPDVVLSAAHCLQVVAKAEVRRYDISLPVDQEGGRRFSLIEKKMHPAYGLGSTYSNDMDYALFKLSDGGVALGNYNHLAINGHTNRPRPGEKVTVIGWGATAEGGYASSILQEVQLDYLTRDQCKEYSGYDIALTDDMMCANVDGGGKDACQGDSGGPLYLSNPSGEPQNDILAGIVSWGVGCARANFPGVYARTAYPRGLDWIKTTACSMTRHSPCPIRIVTPPDSPAPAKTEVQKKPAATAVSNSIVPDGACYIKGKGVSFDPSCAMGETGCTKCDGNWLQIFPACYLSAYGYSSTISLCRSSADGCDKCGGEFISKPPTLTVATANKNKHGSLRQ